MLSYNRSPIISVDQMLFSEKPVHLDSITPRMVYLGVFHGYMGVLYELKTKFGKPDWTNYLSHSLYGSDSPL